MREKQRAHYDLGEIKALVRRNEVSLTRRVERHVYAQGWDSGSRMYVKYTVSPSGRVMILSFCRDGEAH